MGYEVRLHPRTRGQISGWGLSDYLLVEVYLALREELAADPMTHLHRDQDGGGGALFVFDRVDPESPQFRHIFQFRAFFDQDERHLHIVRASYWRYLDPS